MASGEKLAGARTAVLRPPIGVGFVAGRPALETAVGIKRRRSGLFKRTVADVFHDERKRVATRSRPMTRRFYSRRKYFAPGGNFQAHSPVLISRRAAVLRRNHPAPCDLCSTSLPKILTKIIPAAASFSNASPGPAPVTAICRVLMLLTGALVSDAR
jgi:hypothetical protein